MEFQQSKQKRKVHFNKNGDTINEEIYKYFMYEETNVTSIEIKTTEQFEEYIYKRRIDYEMDTNLAIQLKALKDYRLKTIQKYIKKNIFIRFVHRCKSFIHIICDI
jgi:hypothetical protein